MVWGFNCVLYGISRSYSIKTIIFVPEHSAEKISFYFGLMRCILYNYIVYWWDHESASIKYSEPNISVLALHTRARKEHIWKEHSEYLRHLNYYLWCKQNTENTHTLDIPTRSTSKSFMNLTLIRFDGYADRITIGFYYQVPYPRPDLQNIF